MPDGFDLNPDPLAEPLDMGSAVPQVPQPQAPQRNKRAEFIRLAALIPLALKAGPGALEGLLSGYQQAQARREQQAQQQGQQQYQNARLSANDKAQADYRTRTLQGQDQARRQTFLNQFTQGLSGLEDQAAIDAYVKLQQSQAQALGLDPAALQTYVQQTQTPSTVQKRAAEKAVNRLKSQFGEKWLEQGPRFQHMVGGEQVSFDELLRRAGMAPDPNAPPIAPKPDIPNTPEEQQIADVFAITEQQLGRPLTAPERARARLQAVQSFRDAGRADRPAPDPELGDLRKQLLQTQVDAAKDKAAATQETADRAKAAARKTSGDTLEVLNQLIEVKPDGTATLRPGVGNLFGARVPGMQYLPGDTAKAAAALRRLKGRVIVDLLGEMKSQSRTGATGFGQLNARELDLIEGAATTLDSSFISNQTALEELVRLYNIAQKAYDGAAPNASAGTPRSSRPTTGNPFRGGSAGSGR